MAASQ